MSEESVRAFMNSQQDRIEKLESQLSQAREEIENIKSVSLGTVEILKAKLSKLEAVREAAEQCKFQLFRDGLDGAKWAVSLAGIEELTTALAALRETGDK